MGLTVFYCNQNTFFSCFSSSALSLGETSIEISSTPVETRTGLQSALERAAKAFAAKPTLFSISAALIMNLTFPQFTIGIVLPFETALASWKEIVTNPKIKLAVGLAAYRVVDTPSEFWSSGDILKRQVEDSRTASNYGGFSIFRYEDFFSDRLNNERNNLKRILG